MRLALATTLLLLVVGCAQDKAPTAAPTLPPIEGVQSFPDLSHDHLKQGQYPQTYPQKPPVGGPHNPKWIACDVYKEQLPDESAVHSIEHGAVWLTYQPTYAKEGLVVAMAQLNPEYVLVSPYAGQDAQVIATTWGLQLKVQDATDPRLIAFVKKYAGGAQGGEPGVGCASGGITPEEARQSQR